MLKTSKHTDAILKRFAGLIEACIFLLIIFYIIGLLGKYHWLFDLLSHFRVQYCVLFFLGSAALFLFKRKTWAIISLSMGLFLSLSLIKYIIPGEMVSNDKGLSVISYNVLTSNAYFDEVERFLLEEDSDIVFLIEADDQWLQELDGLSERYPYQIKKVRPDNFGVALYSKHKFTHSKVLYFGEAQVPSIEVELIFEDRPLQIIGTHTFPPTGKNNSHNRNSHLEGLANYVKNKGSDYMIVVGDFNVTPYSYHFKDFLSRSGLIDTAIGFGLKSTWLSNLPFVAIPIDHVFITSNLSVLNRRIGDSLGSDHNPIIIHLDYSE